MLYLSTSNKAESCTAHKALRIHSAPDSALFMPMHLPVQNDLALAAFERMNFSETAAAILNLFFGTRLSGWDVDFAVGRQAVDLVSAGYKVSLAESWHNPAGKHEYLVQKLYHLALGEASSDRTPNLWFRTVVDIAVLFSIYGKYCRQEIYEFDVAVESGNLQQLLAIRYAQKMGIPIRKIVLGCMEGDGLWELVSYGDYLTNRKDPQPCLAALLWLEFGYSEAEALRSAAQKRGTYRLKELRLEQFRRGLFAAVVGDHRTKNVVESTMRTNNYQMQSSTARAFAALQDYRARTGENKNTLLFAQDVSAK